MSRKKGSYAEYACYEQDEIVLKPSEMTFQQACAFPLVGCTVMEMYRRHPSIGEVLDREGELAFGVKNKISNPLNQEDRKEMRILVIGASGGKQSSRKNLEIFSCMTNLNFNVLVIL